MLIAIVRFSSTLGGIPRTSAWWRYCSARWGRFDSCLTESIFLFFFATGVNDGNQRNYRYGWGRERGPRTDPGPRDRDHGRLGFLSWAYQLSGGPVGTI